MSDGTSLCVIELSDSFQQLWAELADELRLTLSRQGPTDAPGSETVAVIVAAGGEEGGALDLLPTVPRLEGVPLFVVGAHPSHRFAIEAVRRGAADYFVLPADLDLLRRTLTARAEVARERRRPSRPTPKLDDPFAAFVGTSPALHAVLEQARRVVSHDVTVLIQGETGTGKELLARALHDHGSRANGPFVPVNCTAIPGELMESEFFGHERGAFTDAHAAKPGLFEEADRGTLFLDEIGHLPLPMQGKLLRALEERRIRRVGATQTRPVDVRIMAATLVDLAEAVRRGAFREDLYYRLNVVALTLPPLRERENDAEQLAEAFVASLAERYGLPTPPLTPAVRTTLRQHPWPGNVRELRHAIERALLLSPRGEVHPAALVAPGGRTVAPSSELPFPATLVAIEAAAARAALAREGGNKSAAARALGISRSRFQRLLDRSEGIEP